MTADAELDPTWGGDGFLYAPRLGVVRGITVQPDGKLLLAGSDPDGSYVARLLDDGTPDPTFGEDGVVAFDTGDLRDIALRPDGRLVVAGAARQDAIGVGQSLLGLLPDGSLDPAFGPDGRIVTPIGRGGHWSHVRLLPAVAPWSTARRLDQLRQPALRGLRRRRADRERAGRR